LDIIQERTTNHAQIIADGGMVHFGDMNKAIGAGADFIMSGRFFSGTDEAAGEIVEIEDKKFKSYRGMASKESQIEWRGKYSSDEGVATLVPYKGPVANVLGDIDRCLRGISYSGARTLKEFQDKARFVRVSSASAIEATPHILTR
jgi:IMP dehydrogenase